MTDLNEGIYWDNTLNSLSFETTNGQIINTGGNKYGIEFRLHCTNSGETTGVYSEYFWFAITEICGTGWGYYFSPSRASDLPNYLFNNTAGTLTKDGSTITIDPTATYYLTISDVRDLFDGPSDWTDCTLESCHLIENSTSITQNCVPPSSSCPLVKYQF